jgi:hypothetical protein
MLTVSNVRDWIRNDTIDAHQQELVELAYRHPNADRKNLHETIRVRRDKYAPMGLVAELKDGSIESFSWLKAVRNTENETAAGKIKAAFRDAIFDQTRTVRAQHVYIGRSKYHVGHGHKGTQSFQQLLNTFLDNRGLSLLSVQVENVCKPPLEYHVWQLQDTCLLQEWQEFHREHACLAIEHQHSNLRNLLVQEPPSRQPLNLRNFLIED